VNRGQIALDVTSNVVFKWPTGASGVNFRQSLSGDLRFTENALTYRVVAICLSQSGVTLLEIALTDAPGETTRDE
jgi:hypothetical protein